MFIITNLSNLLASASLAKASSLNVRVNYTDEDRISVQDHIRLSESKLKLTFTESEKNDSIFTIGLKLGTLLSGSETIIYVTDSNELLQTEKVENGKATVIFVKSFDDAVKVYEKCGNKAVRKQRKKRSDASDTKNEEKKVSDDTKPDVKDESCDITAEASITEDNGSGVNESMNPPIVENGEEDTEVPSAIYTDEETEPMDEESDFQQDFPQKTLQGDFSEDPITNIKNMLTKIDPSMTPAYNYIIDAIHDSKEPIEVSYMLPMLVDAPFVEKWESKLEEYFYQLKEQVDKVSPFSHMDDIFSVRKPRPDEIVRG